MMRDTAIRTASESQRRESSAGWYGFVRSAMIAGFEAYGSAQIGIAPSAASNHGAEAKESAAAKTTDAMRSNQEVARANSNSIPGVRSYSSETVPTAVWRHA